MLSALLESITNALNWLPQGICVYVETQAGTMIDLYYENYTIGIQFSACWLGLNTEGVIVCVRV